MEKHYKSRVYRVLLNVLYSLMGAVVVGILCYNLLSKKYALWVAVGVLLLSLWLVILDTMVHIIVKEGKLIVIKGRKRKEFIIDQCSFRARTTTSSGDTSCQLTVIDSEGKEHPVDCDLIGIRQFNRLLEDLGVIGDKAVAQKIETIRRI